MKRKSLICDILPLLSRLLTFQNTMLRVMFVFHVVVLNGIASPIQEPIQCYFVCSDSVLNHCCCGVYVFSIVGESFSGWRFVEGGEQSVLKI